VTCRHSKNDPACSSSPEGQYRALREQEIYNERERKKREAEINARTPNPDQYEILKFSRIGPHVVLMVKYPSCTACAYEGNKVMVIFDVPEDRMIRWRRIDPHFRGPSKVFLATEAPSPAARFPASEEGWNDALDYARRKAEKGGKGERA
jgi:hypothetical protein